MVFDHVSLKVAYHIVSCRLFLKSKGIHQTDFPGLVTCKKALAVTALTQIFVPKTPRSSTSHVVHFKVEDPKQVVRYGSSGGYRAATVVRAPKSVADPFASFVSFLIILTLAMHLPCGSLSAHNG